MPILRTFAEGTRDSRDKVRFISASYLAEAILDRHTKIVPPGVMINILTDVYIPSVLAMGDIFFKSRSSLPFPLPPALEVKGKEPSSDGAAALLTTNEVVTDPESASLTKFILAIFTAFSNNIGKLHSFPSFDKLWLQLLHMMAHFLDNDSEDPSILEIKSLCIKELTNVLQLLKGLDLFSTRVGLGKITEETLLHLSACPNILSESNWTFFQNPADR